MQESDVYDDEKRIKELPTGNAPFDIKSKMKKVSNWITRNYLLVELDFFHTQVKFLVNGSDTFSTMFGGIISLMILAAVAVVTYYVSWPAELTSQITYTKMTKDAQMTGLSICQHHSIPVKLSFRRIFPPPLTGYQILPPEFQIRAFHNTSMGFANQIPVSTNCGDNQQFCLNCNEIGAAHTQIYGGPKHINPEANITFEIYWCNHLDIQNCVAIDNYFVNITLVNIRKQKEMKLEPYAVFQEKSLEVVNGLISNFYYETTRQSYTSNYKFLGHLSNILPWQTQTYEFSPYSKLHTIPEENYTMLAEGNNVSTLKVTISLSSSGNIVKLKQEFVDVGLSIVFFLALLDPVKLIVVLVLLKWYNKNARDLFIANKLFYVEDPVNDEKYNFNSGPAVFFVCLLYRHPITNLFKFIIGCCGYNLTDILPNKCIYTMAMINQGEMLLRQEQFFKLLEGLTAIDNTQSKRVPLIIKNEKQEQQDEEELGYFRNQPIKREAFKRFCEDNQFYSGRKKNRVYNMLIDKKYTTRLKSNAHKIFGTYIRNVENLRSKGKFLETFNDDNVPVDLAKENTQQINNKHEGTEMSLRMSNIED